MKGIIFTEFLEMVEDRFGLETADHIIESASLKSRGAYTAVGTYDHGELTRLVSELSWLTGTAPATLVWDFGKYLFARFAELYPQFFAEVTSAFAFLELVEAYVHAEVRKLYPEAELPTFECVRSGLRELIIEYRSTRPFADLAAGLIAGCAEHFGESIQIEKESLASDPGTCVRFVLTKQVAESVGCVTGVGVGSDADLRMPISYIRQGAINAKSGSGPISVVPNSAAFL